MGIYLISSCMSYMLYKFLSMFKKKDSFIKILVSFLPLIILSAVRYNVGWDYLKIYTNGFFLIGEEKMPQYFTEIPFDFLVKFIYIISNANPDWLFIVCTIITFIFLTKAIKDQSVNVGFSILLVFFIRYYFLTLNIVRQGIAMSILLYSLKYIKENNFKKYIILVILASCFHLMSLVYIPIYFLTKINWKKRKNMFLFVIFPILAIIAIFIIINFTKYGNYINSKFDLNEFLIHEIILSSIVLMLAIVEKKELKKQSEYFDIYFILQLITFGTAILSKFIPVADRIIWYFYLQNIFFIPLLIKNIKSINLKALIVMILFIVLFINVYMQTVFGDSYSIIPYNTIFNK
mgnify:CR=1 FL=1